MATIASAGTIFIPGKLKGSPSERTSRWIKTQQAAQQSRYINKTATFERTASFSNVPLTESINASVAYVMMATSGDRYRGWTWAKNCGNAPSRPNAKIIRGELRMSLVTNPNAEILAPASRIIRPKFPKNFAADSASGASG